MKEQVNDFVAKLDFPMYIVTARGNGINAGCLVGFVTQCSIDPARFLVCLSEKNRTYRVAVKATHIALHLVPGHATELAQLFGSETGDEVDKFAKCRWAPGIGEAPLLADCPSRVVCKVLEHRTLGDHTGFLAEPVEANVGAEDIYMFSMSQAQGLEPGHGA